MYFSKTFYLLLVAAFFIGKVSLSIAQSKDKYRYIEAGIMMGATGYAGDVSEKRINVNEIRLGYGAYARYHFSNLFALKLHTYSGSITGDDVHSPVLKERSFKFATSFVELALTGELHFFKRNRYTKTGIHRFQIYPFIYGGGGILFTSNTAEYYGPPEKRNDYLRVPLPEENLKTRFILIPVGEDCASICSSRLFLALKAVSARFFRMIWMV